MMFVVKVKVNIMSSMDFTTIVRQIFGELDDEAKPFKVYHARQV